MLEYSYYHCVHGSLLCAVYAASSDPPGWTSRSSQSVRKARCRCLNNQHGSKPKLLIKTKTQSIEEDKDEGQWVPLRVVGST